MSFKLRLIVAAPLLVVAGCMTPGGEIESPDPAFGEAVKYSMEMQVIDPDPVYDEDGAQPGDSGVKGAEAVKRYRTDKVKEVKAMTTSTISGQGGTGSGGSGPK